MFMIFFMVTCNVTYSKNHHPGTNMHKQISYMNITLPNIAQANTAKKLRYASLFSYSSIFMQMTYFKDTELVTLCKLMHIECYDTMKTCLGNFQ
jgi:hypothetical protein